MRVDSRSRAVGLLIVLSGGLSCSDHARTDVSRDGAMDATSAVDASSDGARTTDATGVVLDDGTFKPLLPCALASQYVAGRTTVVTQAASYDPPCLQVRVGTRVTIQASPAHPLEPRAGGSAANPIPMGLHDVMVTFSAPGLYPFECPEHVDQGMRGVIWVVP